MMTGISRQKTKIFRLLSVLLVLAFCLAQVPHSVAAAGSSGSKDCAQIYTAKGGESLEDIADKFDVKIKDLAEANDLDKPYDVSKGDKICIPYTDDDDRYDNCAHVHVVEKGENLRMLAKLYDVDKEEIIKANNLKPPYRLTIGEKVCIPGDAADDDNGTCQLSYTVKKNETLKSIANKFDLTVKELADANKMKTSDKVKAGDKLCIPETDDERDPEIFASFEDEMIVVQGDEFTKNTTFRVKVRADGYGRWYILGNTVSDKTGSIDDQFRLPRGIDSAETLNVCVKSYADNSLTCDVIDLK